MDRQIRANRRGWRAAARLVLALALVWWSPGRAESLEPVTLQLKWKHQFQFAGYYAALAKGYYRDAGLDVAIIEAQAGQDPVDRVLRGNADFGVGTSDLLLLRARGEPVVVLAVIFQHSPLVLLARRNDELSHVHDLPGKRVMIEPGSADLVAYLRREGVPLERLHVLPHSFDASALLDGRADAISAYVTDEPFVVHEAGIDTLILTPRAAGIDFYGDNLFTTQDYLDRHPQRVRDFVAASLRGWRYALEHPEEIIELILSRYSQRHSREHLRYEAEQMRYLIQPLLVELGYINAGRWRHIADTFTELGMLPAGVSLEGFLYDAQSRAADLRQIYYLLAVVLGVAALAGLVLLNIHRLNRRLRREVEERKTAEAKFRGLVEQSLVGIFIIQDDRFVYVNHRFAEIFGYPVEDITGRLGPLDLTVQTDREQVRENLRRRLDGEIDSLQHAFSAVRRDGALIDVEVNGKRVDYEGRPAIIGIALDITEQQRAERQLNYLAFYDPLTDLPNRALFFDRLGQALAANRRSREPFGLLLLDLDGFKAVNDHYGHETGDALLQAVGQRLRNSVRQSDTVARIGGDEFVLLLKHLKNPDDAALVAGKIIAALVKPFWLAGRECRVGASIGIGIAPDDGDDIESLLSHADAAMYESKARGKNTWTRYQPALRNGKPLKMVFLEWNEELVVGVPEIDDYHAGLAALLNRISDAVKTGQDQERILALLDELVAITRQHFETEERLMDQHGYEQTIIHKQAHRKLLEDLLSIRRQFNSASLVLTLQALKEWLRQHIRSSDRHLGEALIARGAVQPRAAGSNPST